MEDQNNADPKAEQEQPDRVEGTAKVIRAGGEGRGESPARRLMRAGGGNGAAGAEAAAGAAAAAAAAAAGPVLRAGRAVAEGAQAAAETAEHAEAPAGQALREWANYAQRAYARNTRAVAELMQCRSVFGVLHWQGALLTETMSDFVNTNSRVVRLVLDKA